MQKGRKRRTQVKQLLAERGILSLESLFVVVIVRFQRLRLGVVTNVPVNNNHHQQQRLVSLNVQSATLSHKAQTKQNSTKIIVNDTSPGRKEVSVTFAVDYLSLYHLL